MGTTTSDPCQYPGCSSPAEFRVMGGTSRHKGLACRGCLADMVDLLPGIVSWGDDGDPGTRTVTPLNVEVAP